MDDLTLLSNILLIGIFFLLLFRAFREDWERTKKERQEKGQ
jgi:hypothetical protein